MHIGPLGLAELLVIVVVVALIFGPGLFTKLGKRLKKTGKAAKKGLEDGAKAAGKDIDVDNVGKGDVLGKIDSFQDKLDEKLTEAEQELDDEEHRERAKERAKKVTDTAMNMVEDVAGGSPKDALGGSAKESAREKEPPRET